MSFLHDIPVGYLARGTATAFDGELAEVRVWNTDRSQATIFANYSRRMKGNESGLQYCWPMDDGSGTTCRELVSGANATINNTSQVGWSDTMLPFVLSKQTLSVSTNETLFIGDGTALYLDPASRKAFEVSSVMPNYFAMS